jgi:pantothenate kinase type III
MPSKDKEKQITDDFVEKYPEIKPYVISSGKRLKLRCRKSIYKIVGSDIHVYDLLMKLRVERKSLYNKNKTERISLNNKIEVVVHHLDEQIGTDGDC